MPNRFISLISLLLATVLLVLAGIGAFATRMLGIFQAGNSTQLIGYLITGIIAVAGALGLVYRYSQKKDTRSDDLFTKQLDIANMNLAAERLARTEERGQLLGQLDSLSRLNREAHEREMKQVLEVTGKQTALLDELLRQQRRK